MRLNRGRRELFAIADCTCASLKTLQEQTIITRSYPIARRTIASGSMPMGAALHTATRPTKVTGDIPALLGRRPGFRKAGPRSNWLKKANASAISSDGAFRPCVHPEPIYVDQVTLRTRDCNCCSLRAFSRVHPPYEDWPADKPAGWRLRTGVRNRIGHPFAR